MQLFFQENISGNSFELNPEEANHLVKVLRKNQGDLIQFTDGRGGLFTCKIDELSLKKTRISILSQIQQPADKHYIHLAISPTKNQERIEWMVEKITEIGFHEISFLNTENSEKIFIKTDRLQKKIISACKQSLKTWKPKLNGIREFESFIADPKFLSFQKFIGHLDPENPSHLMDQAKKESEYLILIGPEGDFSSHELIQAQRQNFRACSLGNARLRTETAGLVAVHTLSLINH